MSKIVEKIKNDYRVAYLDLDDPCGPIVTLKKGFTFDPWLDNRVRGEDTATKLMASIRCAYLYTGPFTD